MTCCAMHYHEISDDFKEFTMNKFCENIVFPDRIGKWHGIDLCIVSNYADTEKFSVCLFEHNRFGDLAGFILAFYDRYSDQWVELAETWDDIVQAMTDECII